MIDRRECQSRSRLGPWIQQDLAVNVVAICLYVCLFLDPFYFLSNVSPPSVPYLSHCLEDTPITIPIHIMHPLFQSLRIITILWSCLFFLVLKCPYFFFYLNPAPRGGASLPSEISFPKLTAARHDHR